jgi:hypothetical protein
MSEPKTTCSDCGATIPQRAADTYDGRCYSCHRRYRGFTPDDFELSANQTERLVALDMDPAYYRHVAWEHGPDFLDYFIDEEQKRHQLYRTWLPRLRAFADDCRITRPLPGQDSLSRSEQEQQRIYKEKMERSRPGSESAAAICRMPIVAMPVAKRLWCGHDDHTILLTPEEESRWREMCLNSDEIHWLFHHCWWIIDDAPKQEFAVPPGEQSWLLDWGESGRPLAGWGCHELWAWDGTRARLIRNVGAWRS